MERRAAALTAGSILLAVAAVLLGVFLTRHRWRLTLGGSVAFFLIGAVVTYVGYTTRPSYGEATSTIHRPASRGQGIDSTGSGSDTTQTIAVSAEGSPTIELDFRGLSNQPDAIRVNFGEEE